MNPNAKKMLSFVLSVMMCLSPTFSGNARADVDPALQTALNTQAERTTGEIPLESNEENFQSPETSLQFLNATPFMEAAPPDLKKNKIQTPANISNGEYKIKISRKSDQEIKIIPLRQELGQPTTFNFASLFGGILQPKDIHLTELKFLRADQTTIVETNFQGGYKIYVFLKPGILPSEPVSVKAGRGTLTPDQKWLIYQETDSDLVVRNLEKFNGIARLTNIKQYVFPMEGHELFPIDRTVVSNQYVILTTLRHFQLRNEIKVIDLTGPYPAIKYSQIPVPQGENLANNSFISGSIIDPTARIHLFNGNVYEATLNVADITWQLIATEELPAPSPITQAGLIDKIRTKLLAGVVLRSVKGVATGHMDLVAAIAFEKPDSFGNQNRHVFIYSTQGEAKLRVDYIGQAGQRFHGLAIDQTQRIAILKDRQLDFFVLSQDNRIDLYGPSIDSQTYVNIISNPDQTLTVQVYPKEEDGIEQVVSLETGMLRVTRSSHFIPAAILATLPKTFSNSNFVIEERKGPGGLLGNSHWNLYTTDGKYITTFNKDFSFIKTVNLYQWGVDEPDVNSEGTYAISGQRTRRQYNGGSVIDETQYVSVYNIATKQERSIKLKSPTQEIATDIRFIAGSSTTIQVTYPSREVAFYDVTTGQPISPGVPAG